MMNTSGRRACLVVAVTTAVALPMGWGIPAVASPGAIRTAADAVSAQEFTPIEKRYWGESELRALLGNPVDTEYTENGISYQQFQRGWLYYSEIPGVHAIQGEIAREFVQLGAHRRLGAPTTDERPTPDGVGRFNWFTGIDRTGVVGIYWHPDLGAHGIWGPIRDFWATNGFETGYLSYPTSTTSPTAGNVGLASHFVGADGAGASVFWTPETGAHSVQGAIRDKWAEQGWEVGLGYPTNDETPTSDGVGRYSTFTGTEDPPAAIYWHPNTGTHFMRGTIYRHYTQNLSGEASYLGYPVSDQYVRPETGDTWVDFQGGFIRIDADTGEVIDGRW